MGLFGKHRLVHTRSCKAFAELPPCRWPSRRLLPTIRPASGDGASPQLDEKRPTRAVEKLHQVAATKTERRLHVQVTSPNRTSGQVRDPTSPVLLCRPYG